MAKEWTPKNWPQCEETDGMLAGLRAKLGLWLSGSGLRPGAMDVPLARGSCLSMAPGARVNVRCLEGQAWATGLGGLDVLLPAGASQQFSAPGKVVITALVPGTLLRLRWR